ncbi:hypothetical protein C8Q80DRAFT_1213914 [Daedaleopsis nitida]|nr:hypothetical protein C8Q80DRAFT_1213914 [Daedaleopsis nitida]
MAQPLFDQHPLEEYFRHSGEVAEPMPGGAPDFVVENDDFFEHDYSSPPHDTQLPEFILSAIQIARDLLQSSTCTSHENSFEERFKYDVISSSLLSSSLAAAPTSTVRRSITPELPGKLDDGGGTVTDEDSSTTGARIGGRFPDHSSNPNTLEFQVPVALFSVAVVVLSTGYTFLAMIPLFAAIYARYVLYADMEKNDSTAQTLDTLNELISAGNVWDSAVNEAMLLIESEERSIFYGPTSPQAPSSALRIALHSSLHTTQTQCDNVRQLISALTNPASLSQLAEMYAPSSPIRPTLTLPDTQRSPSSTMRPFSHPSGTWRQRTTSLPSSKDDKRATWNGSYAALALAGSPTSPVAASRKKNNRRSDVMSLFQPMPSSAGPVSSFSAPVTPRPISPTPERLEVLEEEDHGDEELESKEYFGAAALDLQRNRKSAGLEALNVPPPSYTPPRSPLRGSMSGAQSMQPLTLLSSTTASSSRLTSVHTTRHPLSLSGLHLAMQGALASKRYSCSHLLALRFSEDEDDSYWENVRSVMALLSSTFSDASSRLFEALDDAEKRRIKDENPTPPRGNTPTPQDQQAHRRSINMSRFAGHVDAISTALSDAREHVEECIAALRNPSPPISSESTEAAVASVQDHPAFQAYDRLRKELGFALRECERGRERLLDLIAPRPLDEGDGEASPHTPGLKHDDSGSESSEKGPVSPHVPHGVSDSGLGLTLAYGREEHEHDLDDATAHLLLTASSQHLPPPGAEQVFEGESGDAGAFTRARSKLSREERIAIMKARRVSGVPLSGVGVPQEEVTEQPGREKWGPGGEVVQELKDVIWKVGEKRRRMSQQLPQRTDEHRAAAVQDVVVRPVPELEAEAEAEVVDAAPESRTEETTAVVVPFFPDRETSIAISVDEGSLFEEEDDDVADGLQDESELAYLDSPTSARLPELPAHPLHSPIDGPAADDTPRTTVPAHVLSAAESDI